MERVVWQLNLDAEDELARLGRGYAPSHTVVARIESLRPLLRPLVGDGAILDGNDRFAPGAPGRAWCPTPRALAALDRAGARPPRAPAAEILRAVAHRKLVVELGSRLPGAIWLDDPLAIEAHLAGYPPGEPWRLKRAFAYAGRGHRRIRAGALDAIDRGWLAASAGGVLAEPEVSRARDLSIHGYLMPDGELVAGAPTQQEVDRGGTWRASRAALDLSASERAWLEDALSRVAERLRRGRYFGPFGVDGYRGTLRGEAVVQPISDVNARYTMGWATGMGAWRAEPGLP